MTAALMPGQEMAAPILTTTSTASVKRTRFRSSGILKVFVNAEITKLFQDDRSPRLFDLLAGGSADFVRGDGKALGDFAVAENLDAVEASANEVLLAKTLFIHRGALVELGERAEIHQRVARLERGIVEAALGQAADEGHLAAFEPEADAAAGTGFLAFVSLAARLAVAGALSAAETLDPVFRAGARF